LSIEENTNLGKTQRMVDGWKDGWKDGCMDGWIDGWVDRLNKAEYD
jgi:hypothetical protein